MAEGAPKDEDAVNASLHEGFNIVPGHFSYHTTSDPNCIFEHFNRCTSNWYDFANKITRENRPNSKVMYFLRHAEGEHNAAKARLGAEVWFRDVACTKEYLDPHLTAKGEAASKNTALRMKLELDNGMPLEKVILSPLRRTLQTGTTVFGSEIGKIPFVSMELCRETIGMHSCDKRSQISEMAAQFPMVDFSDIEDEEDVLWQLDHRETMDEIQTRAVAFLKHVYERVPETYIAVVSHVGFIGACLRVFRQQEYRLNNCEIVPLVIQFNSPVENP